MASPGRLPSDALFPPIASDWLTGESSPNVIYRDGKWWTSYHWEHWRKDREADRRRLDRNRAVKTFLRGQPNDWE